MSSVYLDTSALTKLVIREAESQALRTFLADRPAQMSSVLARIELTRLARRNGELVTRRSERLLRRLQLIAFDEGIVRRAGMLDPPTLRSLDAIHVASALTLQDELEALVTYDGRMRDAAELHGLPVAAPA